MTIGVHIGAMSRLNKEPISAYTHFAGMIGAIVVLILLVASAAGDTPKTVGVALFGSTAVLLFGASSAYHYFDLGPRWNQWLKRLDHVAIFLFIAGSYIAPMIHTLDGAWRITMLSVVGGIAVAGVLFKLLWVDCPRWLSAGLYLAMGWVIVIPGPLVLPRLPLHSLLWVVVGGLAYTVGAVIYTRQKPDPIPGVFGFHEVWHLFVLAGAACHAVFMVTLLDQPYPPFGG